MIRGNPWLQRWLIIAFLVQRKYPTLKFNTLKHPHPNTFGQKGIGEGGAIGPPAAIANAVNDALKIFNAEVRDLPITPKRIWQAISEANELNGVKA